MTLGKRLSPPSSPESTCEITDVISPFPIAALHLKPSSSENFYSLPVSTVGRYELLDGHLSACAMTKGRHEGAVTVCIDRFNRWKRRKIKDQIKAGQNPRSTEDVEMNYNCVPHPIVYVSSGNEIRPDLAIGIPEFGERACFPKERPPKLVMEVTSSNWRNDLDVKPAMYAAAKIPHYVIVHRRRIDSREASSEGEPVVMVGTRKGSGYSFEDYGRGETISLPFIGRLNVNDMLYPESSSDATIESVEEELNNLAKQKGRADRQKGRADRHKERADRHKEKADRLRRKLIANGIPLSSSSSDSSPRSSSNSSPNSGSNSNSATSSSSGNSSGTCSGSNPG